MRPRSPGSSKCWAIPVRSQRFATRSPRTAGREDYLLLVCEGDAQEAPLFGWIQAHSNEVVESGFRVEIVGLIVDERTRREGVGRMLVGGVEDWARGLGARRVVVRSNVLREGSHRFYEELGFVPTKTQMAYRKELTEKE